MSYVSDAKLLKLLQINAELLKAAKIAHHALDDCYDVERPIDGPPRERPFIGAGRVLEVLRRAIDRAEGKYSDRGGWSFDPEFILGEKKLKKET